LINLKEKYFLASYRYSKKSPSDFGLRIVNGKNYFLDNNNNKWKSEYLWDSGWGNEYGFIRLPEPNFDQLWILLTESNIEDNKLGASELLNRDYPFKLKRKLKDLFKRVDKFDRNLTKRLELLEVLTNISNYSKIDNVSPEKVNYD